MQVNRYIPFDIFDHIQEVPGDHILGPIRIV